MNDRTSTDEELAQVMLIQQIEQIQAYMEKFNAKEKERVQAETND